MPDITISTANVCSNPLRAQSSVNTRIRQVMANGGVVFGQEITPARYKSAWALLARRRGRTTYGKLNEVPISMPTAAWKGVKSRVVKVHGGKRKVSPNRYMTVTTGYRAGLRVAFINVHTVSKGYGAAKKHASYWSWRNAMLQAYWKRLGVEIAHLHAQGYTVIVGGDCNWPEPSAPHAQARVLVQSGLDHLWVVPAAGTKVTNIRPHVAPKNMKIGMDHPILTARFTLTKGH